MESEEDRVYGASPGREDDEVHLSKPMDEDRRSSSVPRQQEWAEDDQNGRCSADEDDEDRHSRRRNDRATDDNNPTMSLLVRHLRFATSPATVRKYFEQCGEVKDVYLPLDYERGNPRGFGFVEFANRRDAESALRELDNTELDGSTISISVAQHGRKTPSTMRMRSSGNRRRYRREPYERSGSPPSYRGGNRRYRDFNGPPPRYEGGSSYRSRDEDRGRGYERGYDREYDRGYDRGRSWEHRESRRDPPSREPESGSSRGYARRGSR